MAKDTSRRPTKRQKTPVQAGAAPKVSAPAKKAAAPRVSLKKKPAAKAAAAKPTKAKVKVASGSPKSSAGKGGARGAVAAARSLVGKASAPRTPRERRERHQRVQTLRIVAYVVAGLLGLLLVAAITLFALRDSSVFSIDGVEVAPTEHVTESDIQNLVKVPAGSTLLNVDTASIEEALKKDPWIASVSFERVFPHTLRIVIHEQAVDALVVMSSGSIAWYLGDGGSWIQPTSVTAAEDQSVDDAALESAMAEGCLLITDVPATVAPEAGLPATDASLLAVQKFREGFSEDFASQVVSYSAPSEDNISCTLESGVEVLLGSPTDIATKQAFVEKIIEKNPGTLLFINVRVPTEKGTSFRTVESENVQGGSGVASTEELGGDLPVHEEEAEQQAQAEGSQDDAAGEGEGQTLDQDGAEQSPEEGSGDVPQE